VEVNNMREKLLEEIKSIYDEYENLNYNYSLASSNGDTGKAINILERERRADLENIIDPFIDEFRPLIEDEELEEWEWEKNFDLTTDEVLELLTNNQLQEYINHLEVNLKRKEENFSNEYD